MPSKATRLEVKRIVLVCKVGKSKMVDRKKVRDARGSCAHLSREVHSFQVSRPFAMIATNFQFLVPKVRFDLSPMQREYKDFAF
jgi:hypothetical protein